MWYLLKRNNKDNFILELLNFVLLLAIRRIHNHEKKWIIHFETKTFFSELPTTGTMLAIAEKLSSTVCQFKIPALTYCNHDSKEALSPVVQ